MPGMTLEGTGTVSTDMFSSLITAITTQITPSELIAVIGAVIGATVVFRFMWWGVGYVQAKLWPAILNKYKKRRG